MAEKIRLLCVHGVGGHHMGDDWKTNWSYPIEKGIRDWRPEAEIECRFFLYDELFAAEPIHTGELLKTLAKMFGSGIYYGVTDLLHPRERGLFSLPDRLRWTAGMVAQWAESEPLREKLRGRLSTEIRDFRPNAVAAHSLGSLICYDTFIRSSDQSKSVLLTFGSQIGNPFVRSIFGGRLSVIPCRKWFHLYNKNDDVLTAPLRLEADNFTQLTTEFDLAGFGDHDASAYLSHPNTGEAWGGIANEPTYRRLTESTRSFTKVVRTPNRRALLVGINDYPDSRDQLSGCLNDVFLMSSVLQESGVAPEDIRVVFDDRATASGMRSRLSWLLEGVKAGDERLFFYSGHGAQIPGYGANETVDRQDECLVPYDFDWTKERAICDDELLELYSQLPYESTFMMVLDCCHSGGMSRDGGSRVRGLTPPDDIRHRALKWESKHQMWVDRRFTPPNKSLADHKDGALYLGQSRANHRLGRGINLRSLSNHDYDRVRTALGHHGPYLPTILSACAEGELASEYRHGVTSYGAFTYSLAKAIRAERKKRPGLTFERLVTLVRDELKTLGYDQTPELLATKDRRKGKIPWQ